MSYSDIVRLAVNQLKTAKIHLDNNLSRGMDRPMAMKIYEAEVMRTCHGLLSHLP